MTGLPSGVTSMLRTMSPPPGIAHVWNFSVFGSKRTIVFGLAGALWYNESFSRRVRRIVSNFGGCSVLLQDRGCGAGRTSAYFVDAFLNAMDRLNRAAGRCLHCQNVLSNLFGCLRCLHGEQFYFGGNDREAPPRFTSPRRLYGRVKGEKVRLPGDVAD
jgi:hypothetical protein